MYFPLYFLNVCLAKLQPISCSSSLYCDKLALEPLVWLIEKPRLQPSLILRSSKVASILVLDKLEWTPYWISKDWRNYFLGRRRSQHMKDEGSEDLDERASAAIQLCLLNEILESFEKITTSLCNKLQEHYLKKFWANHLILKQHLFLLRMYEGTPLISLISWI